MAFEEKVALESIKPASGLINALISPKVEKLKKWAEKKELENQLDPEILSSTLEKYLNTLASRVSVISSICFPQKEFAIEKAYEPLYLEEYGRGHEDKKIPITNIVNKLDRSCLIIDGAGMGKSTFSKYIITQIIRKSDRIPVLFELRKSRTDIDLIESIAKELDPIGKIFSRELFYELLQHGKFVIILDGFDEVEIERQQDVAEQINDISIKSNNILLLTTRPQELIPSILHAQSYKFSCFNIEQAKSLVNRLDNISGLDIGERLIEEFSDVPKEFLENPLLVSLLYTTYGSNNTIADRSCTFYSDIYHALYKGHDLINKNGFEREKLSELDYEQFRVLLRALCFQMVLKRKTAFSSPTEAIDYINSASQLSKIELKSANGYFNDLLNAVPLMQKDGNDYKFLHKTVVEYFAAEYIVYRSDSERTLNLMFNSKSFRTFNKVFDFVYELAVETFDNVVTKFHAEKIYNNIDLVSENKAIISTATYLHDMSIGIFSIEKITASKNDSNNENIDDIFEPNHEIILKQKNIRSWTWDRVNIDGKEYCLVVCSAKDNINIHNKAWVQLTTDISSNIDEISNIKDKDLTKVMESIGIDKWVSVDDKLINVLSLNDFICHLFTRFLDTETNFTHASKSRILSSSKVQLFLDGLQAQKDIEDELSSLLLDN